MHLRKMAFSFCVVTLFIKMSVIYSSFLTGGITQSGLKDWAFELYTLMFWRKETEMSRRLWHSFSLRCWLGCRCQAVVLPQPVRLCKQIIWSLNVKQGFLFRITIKYDHRTFLSIRVVTIHNAKLNRFHVFWRHVLFLFIRAASTLFMSLKCSAAIQNLTPSWPAGSSSQLWRGEPVWPLTSVCLCVPAHVCEQGRALTGKAMYLVSQKAPSYLPVVSKTAQRHWFLPLLSHSLQGSQSTECTLHSSCLTCKTRINS